MMLREDQTCPNCGALVTPQLARCRQCGHYLHGSQVEGFLVETLLPKAFAASPGTSLLTLYCMLTYLLMVLLAGPGALAGFRPLALLQLGSTVSTEVQDLEPWRFVSSVFAHGSLLHILFNLYALSIVGPLVERLHDKKRVITFFVVTGAVSMFGSYAYRILLLDQAFFAGSVGASGAISGLMGVAWYATRQTNSRERDAHPTMTRWALLLLLWGLIPGVDGAAHLVGLLVGALVGWLIPEGLPERRSGHSFWSAAAATSIGVVLASSGLTLAFAKDQPYHLEDDAVPRRMLMFKLEDGAPWRESGQYQALNACLSRAVKLPDAGPKLLEVQKACELAIRAVPSSSAAHLALARVLASTGQESRARRQQEIARRLTR